MIAYCSFGAGVQSTTIAFLAINRDRRLLEWSKGILPDVYVFADTGDEPVDLYPHVDEMKKSLAAAGADLVIVKHDKAQQWPLSANILNGASKGKRIETLPFFVQRSTREGFAPTARNCTRTYKIRPIRRYVKARFKINRKSKGQLENWLGISHDEPNRLRVSKDRWQVFRYPLFDLRLARFDCLEYLKGCSYIDGSPVRAARSACVFCPFHDKAEWRRVRNQPADWSRAVAIDEALETSFRKFGKIGALKSELFLTTTGQRLRDLKFGDEPDPRRQFWDEDDCSGNCGV